MSDYDGIDGDLITLTELADYGLTAADVYRRCPRATEYTASDGSPCWSLADLAPLLSADDAP